MTNSGRGKGPGLRPALLAFIFLVVGLGSGLLYAEQPTRQPSAYNHLAHTQKTDCVRCHRGARDGIQAGLPDMGVCADCHATAPGKEPSAADEALWAEVLRDKAPAWNRIYRLPGHTRFSHRQHVTAGQIACVECHGEMDKRTDPPDFPLVQLKMRQCVGCHQNKKVTVDCTTCHS